MCTVPTVGHFSPRPHRTRDHKESIQVSKRAQLTTTCKSGIVPGMEHHNNSTIFLLASWPAPGQHNLCLLDPATFTLPICCSAAAAGGAMWPLALSRQREQDSQFEVTAMALALDRDGMLKPKKLVPR